ncbi:MAG: hypothetical protein ABJH05_15320 [Fulvivirga sp.]
MRISKVIVITFLWLLLGCNHNSKSVNVEGNESSIKKQTELILLGTVHQPVEHFNSDSLYNILVKIKPDLILFEVDSSFFTEEFQFKSTWESNENLATVKYMNQFDVDVRPYEFTGRNEYRIKIGSRPTDSRAIGLLDSLYRSNMLALQEQKIYAAFVELTDTLNSFAYQGAKAFNNTITDSISRIRQHYQYDKLLQIMRNNPLFSTTYLTKEDGDSISYARGYEQASKFWDLRNQTMAKHILHFVDLYKGKKIVVLNGYYHRYYLNELLSSQKDAHHFRIKDFYDY